MSPAFSAGQIGLPTVPHSPGQSRNWAAASSVPGRVDFFPEFFTKFCSTKLHWILKKGAKVRQNSECVWRPRYSRLFVESRWFWPTPPAFGAPVSQCSRIRIFLFSDLKKHDFLRFFEMTYQNVVKSHQQKFSPQYVTKEWSLRSMVTVIQFLAPKSHCWKFGWSDKSVGTKLQTRRDWGQSSWPCLRPFKPQTVAEAAVVGLPGSKRLVGTLGSVRFWQQWRGTINIKQPYIRVSKLNVWLDYDANIKSIKFAACLLKFLPQNSRMLSLLWKVISV